MASVVINGDTSGSVTLQAPAAAGATTITLPAANGTMAMTPLPGAEIVDGSVTAAKLDGAQSGSAPAYAARAWVNFDGGGGAVTPTIRASGNVSSISDYGTGAYGVNLITAMPDTNYAISISWQYNTQGEMPGTSTLTTGSYRIQCRNVGGSAVDTSVCTSMVIR